MPGHVAAPFLDRASRSNGIILVTGPTGSGKTTTLYSTLRRIGSSEVNVMTIEDPIEYELSTVGRAVSQAQVNGRKGLTFATGLRHILRQDPDIVMVGEIRDAETARTAIQASLTGHLVLSTLHTNDAPSAVTRLIDLGVEPYLVASSLSAVLAQRLVRLTHAACGGFGCEACLGTGFRGRTGLFELMVARERTRELISRRAPMAELRPVRARAAGPGSSAGAARRALAGLGDWRDRLLRRRRIDQRAELYDGLATMLESGLPLIEAVDALVQSIRRPRSSERAMLVTVREALRGGRSPAEAMAGHPAWFDAGEVAMVRAGHHSGTLPEVLASLARRHERAGELGHKLAQALAYPALVAMVGLGVVVFLSVNTLPNLVTVLTDAGIEPPAWLRRLSPPLLRRMALAQPCLQLAPMIRSGVPLVEALRVLAPTAARGLRPHLTTAADRLERGDELAAALDEEHWFDAEFRRLLEIGESSGELDSLLERLGRRSAGRAFTLVELLAVIVIVSLVASAATVPLSAASDHARLEEAAARWRDLDARPRLLARSEGAVLMRIDERDGCIALRRAGSGDRLGGFPLPRGVSARVERSEAVEFDRLGRSRDYLAVLASEDGQRRWRVFGLTGWIAEEEAP